MLVIIIVILRIEALALCQDQVSVCRTELFARYRRNEEGILRDHASALLVAGLDCAIVDCVETIAQDGYKQVKHDDHCECAAKDEEYPLGHELDCASGVVSEAGTDAH